jgi:NAD+ kinase
VTINAIGLVVHTGKQQALDAADRVRSWAAEHGIGCTDIDVWSKSGARS